MSEQSAWAGVVESLVEMVKQHCQTNTGVLMDFAISANEGAFYELKRLGIMNDRGEIAPDWYEDIPPCPTCATLRTQHQTDLDAARDTVDALTADLARVREERDRLRARVEELESTSAAIALWAVYAADEVEHFGKWKPRAGELGRLRAAADLVAQSIAEATP